MGREHLCKNSRTLRMLCLCPQLVVNFFRKLCFFFNFCFCLVFIFVVFVFVLFLFCFSVFFFPVNFIMFDASFRYDFYCYAIG